MLICIWYAINFAVSAFFEWKFVNPASYVLWNGFFLFEALCVFIILIFLWSHLLAYFKPVIQITGHIFGLIFFFLVMGTLSYYFTDYMDGLVYFEHWKEYMLGLMSWDALRFYNQYIITAGAGFLVRSFFALLSKSQTAKNVAV